MGEGTTEIFPAVSRDVMPSAGRDIGSKGGRRAGMALAAELVESCKAGIPFPGSHRACGAQQTIK